MNASGTHETGFATLAEQFGRASLVVILGVLACWVLIKRDGVDARMELPDLGVPAVDSIRAATAQPNESLLDRADLAFAAGRIIEPEYDNALAYYTALEEQDPGNISAEAGIERVIGFVLSQGEGAIYRGDWAAARAYAAAVDGIRAGHAGASSLTARAARLERLHQLNTRALAQFSAGRLTAPPGDNAAETYRAILSLDAQSSAALRGLESVAERLVTNAQSAVFAGNIKQADSLIAQAKTLDSAVPGIAEVERSARQWKRIADDSSLQNDLLEAAAALQADRLMPPDEPNAYSLFTRALQRAPASEAALRGLDLVRQGLIDRAWRAMRAGDLGAAATALAHAVEAGVDDSELVAPRDELGYQQRLADARTGSFDRRYEISQLVVSRREIPEYPRAADKRGLHGSVALEFTVDEDGNVRDPTVIQSSNEVFDRAALAAISKWEFEPVIENERPVPVRTSVKFVFNPNSAR